MSKSRKLVGLCLIFRVVDKGECPQLMLQRREDHYMLRKSQNFQSAQHSGLCAASVFGFRRNRETERDALLRLSKEQLGKDFAAYLEKHLRHLQIVLESKRRGAYHTFFVHETRNPAVMKMIRLPIGRTLLSVRERRWNRAEVFDPEQHVRISRKKIIVRGLDKEAFDAALESLVVKM